MAGWGGRERHQYKVMGVVIVAFREGGGGSNSLLGTLKGRLNRKWPLSGFSNSDTF